MFRKSPLRLAVLVLACLAMNSSALSDSDLRARLTEARGYGLPKDGLLLVADTATQTLTVFDGDTIVSRLLMSTAVAGTGNRENSNQTPLGWHRVEERFGAGEPIGRVFKSRAPQRELVKEFTAAESGDYVLTRILWLRGLQPGYNAGKGIDSHDRCIYLHGTNQEHLLGTPASHGCIRLANADIVELFDRVASRECWCLIQ